MKATPLLDADAGKLDPVLIPNFKRGAVDMDKGLVGFIVEKIMKGAKITQEMVDAAEKEQPDSPEYMMGT
jgi:hypothetical protein